MSALTKFLIGLAAVVLLAWLHHGPLGNGKRFVASLEVQAREVVVASELTHIQVHMAQDPLARVATLSGAADTFQRFGMGSQPGLTQMVESVPGIARADWADRPARGPVIPLLAETILLTVLGYLIGLTIAWLIWGRKRRDRYA